MQRLWLALLLCLGLVIGGVVPAAAADANLDVLHRLFSDRPATADMFTPGILAQVPIEQINLILAKTRASVGAIQSIVPDGKAYLVHTSTYSMPVDIALDRDGKIAGLLLHTAVPVFTSPEAVLAAAKTLPGQVGWLVTRNGHTLYAQDADQKLAVASAFKLGILAALDDEIEAGHIAWDQVVRLKAGEISLPTGTLQTLPAGSPLTVHTLAAFMVAQSDNTAADMLIDLLGRDAVGKKLGIDMPLKTSELFKLKADPALRVRFGAADDAGKRKLLDEIDGMKLPAVSDIDSPLDDTAEWYVPLTRLCGLVEAVKGLDVFTINPGVASQADWPGITFKGGSEIGVLSLVTALTDKAGNTYCAAMVWNDHKALNEPAFTALYSALIDKLAQPGSPAPAP